MGRYSDALMDHFASPRNSGPLANPDVVGLAGSPGQGPYMMIQLALEEGRIKQARFQTHGCGVSIAAGSALTELAVGRTIAEGLALTAQDVTDALDGVPPDKLHCPILAVAALHDALGRHVHSG